MSIFSKRWEANGGNYRDFAARRRDVLRVDAELFHHFSARRADAEAMQVDDFAIEADVLIPNLGHAGFDGDAFTAGPLRDIRGFTREALEARP